MSDRIYIEIYMFVLALTGLFPVDVISQEIKPSPDCLPPYVKKIPRDHYVGISLPMPSIAEARQSAIDDAKRQILNSMGSNYQHSYFDYSSGNVISGKIERTVVDEFRNDSQGFLVRIESSIVDSHWITNVPGNYICFVLIRCSDKMIRNMQRLSKGALVIGRVLEFNANRVVLQLTESNGFCVTFFKAIVSITHLRKWTKAVSLFFWHVDEETEVEYEISIQPLSICAQKKQMKFVLDEQIRPRSLFSNLSSSALKAVLHGFDEIGRPVIIKIESN